VQDKNELLGPSKRESSISKPNITFKP